MAVASTVEEEVMHCFGGVFVTVRTIGGVWMFDTVEVFIQPYVSGAKLHDDGGLFT